MNDDIDKLHAEIRRQVRETTGLDDYLLTLRLTQPPPDAHEAVRKWASEVSKSMFERLQEMGMFPAPPSDPPQ